MTEKCIVIENSLEHNSRGYGIGKFYVAKITGTHEKYGFERKFLNRETKYDSGSKTTWYSYKIRIKEDGLYELSESNAFKKEKCFFLVKDSIRIDDEEEIEKMKNAMV